MILVLSTFVNMQVDLIAFPTDWIDQGYDVIPY